ncbi:phytoene desaturase family protein [Butyrivibrio sp. AE3004]|uniref:phytoene desaturase family protein n=1 Tax=Butyrivibrio sp. AE3004 TaxID=1506994 RepID=UPI000494A6EF|nr:FAD-dependent oxidoreductase [Butyrivibrio sp. AE3004]
MKKTEKIIIIGGGISGLSAGIYAQLAGFKAEIYEKNSVPGGECMGWNREGYHIDNCIHWLTGTKKGTELYDVWKTVGAISENTKFVGLKSFYTSCLNGKKATLWADLERTRRELTELSPKDKDEIDKFIEYVEYSKQCQVPAEKPMDMFGIGDYIRYGKSMGDFVKVIKELGNISLEEYSKRFKSPLLQKLFCDYLPKEYTAYSLLVSYASIADGNGDIPMGASLEMSLRMEKRFKDLGGKIFYNKTVDKILLRGKKAEAMLLSDGRRVEGDYFIATVDTSILFGKMLDKKYMPKALQKAYASTKDYPAVSGFQVAYTADKDFNPGETVFIDIEPLKVGGRTVDRMYVKVYGYDPKFVKDGKQVIQTNIVQSDDDYAFWKSLSKEEYKRVKEELVLAVTKRIEAEYPMLKGKLHCLDSWTPLTYERYCNAYHGSYMSFITTPTGKQVRLKGNIGRIRNLCFAGQWNSAPGGLPVAVTNGKFAIQRICKNKGFFKGGNNDKGRTEGREKKSNTYDSTYSIRGERVS